MINSVVATHLSAEVTIVLTGGKSDSAVKVWSAGKLVDRVAGASAWSQVTPNAQPEWDGTAGTWTVKVPKQGDQRFYRGELGGELTGNVGGYSTLRVDPLRTRYAMLQFDTLGVGGETEFRVVGDVFAALPASSTVTFDNLLNNNAYVLAQRGPAMLGGNWNAAGLNTRVKRGQFFVVYNGSTTAASEVVTSGVLADKAEHETKQTTNLQERAGCWLPLSGSIEEMGMPLRAGVIVKCLGQNGGLKESRTAPPLGNAWNLNAPYAGKPEIGAGEGFLLFYTANPAFEWSIRLAVDPASLEVDYK